MNITFSVTLTDVTREEIENDVALDEITKLLEAKYKGDLEIEVIESSLDED